MVALNQDVSPEVAQKRAAQLDRIGLKHETVIYPGTQHAFFSDTRAVFNPQAAAAARQRMVDWFRKMLV
ncbi:MAG: dienelactone hydrolase family protein [Anaerolineales bacterium]|nr:dienelactone hydrolase family protein [Anaerolineales bacterium]